jgi:hypothetical protein
MSPLTDSYDALRRSIEKALKSDLPQGPLAELAASIDHALLEEARSGELTLAYLRLLAVAAYVVVAVWAFVSPESVGAGGYRLSEAALGVVWGSAAAKRAARA